MLQPIILSASRAMLPLALLLLLGIGSSLSAQTPLPAPVTYSNTWAVQITPGSNPDAIAVSAGMVNRGPIGSLAGYYLFEQPQLNTQAATSSQSVTRTLATVPGVTFAQQQQLLVRETRQIEDTITDPLFGNQWHLQNTGQSGGTIGQDSHIVAAWNAGYTGDGVVVSSVDNGIWPTHPDIAPNYNAEGSYDYLSDDSDPGPSGGHGNSVAGLMAADADGATCGVGVAFDAQVSGIRLVGLGQTDALEAAALSHRYDINDIYNNSWGPSDNGSTLQGPGPLTQIALANGIDFGRGGLGAIYVWAGGNGRNFNDNTNADGYVASIYTIGVAAIDHSGNIASYSDPGSSLLVSAPSAANLSSTVGPIVTSGYGVDNCNSNFGGTSSASPIAAGIIALMLEANPNLTWRDVQHILVETAERTDLTDPGWAQNGVGRWFSHDYGFGRIDAAAAVTAAETWQTVGQWTGSITSASVNETVPEGTGSLTSTMTITDPVQIEHVTVTVNAFHARRGQLEFTLTSPDGTESRLMYGRLFDTNADYLEWSFMSTHFWGEDAIGTWTLTVTDVNADGITGTLDDWVMYIAGQNALTPNNLQVIAIDDTSTTLSWSDTFVNETGYVVESSTDGDIWATAANLPADSEMHTATGLTPCTLYYWRVYAMTDSDPSAPSNVDVGETTGCVDAPSNLVAGSLTENSVVLTWTDNADNETDVVVEQQIGDGDWTVVANLPADTTTFMVTGLATCEVYSWRLYMLNGATVSDLSNVVTERTLGCTELVVNGVMETDADGDKRPDNWQGKGNLVKGDKLKTNRVDHPTKPDKTFAHTGTTAFQFKGKPDKNARLQQVFTETGLTASDELLVSAWVQGKELSNGLQIRVIVKYADLEERTKVAITVTPGTYIYTEFGDTVSLLGTVEKVKVQLRFKTKDGSGKAFIDDVSLLARPAITKPPVAPVEGHGLRGVPLPPSPDDIGERGS